MLGKDANASPKEKGKGKITISVVGAAPMGGSPGSASSAGSGATEPSSTPSSAGAPPASAPSSSSSKDKDVRGKGKITISVVGAAPMGGESSSSSAGSSSGSPAPAAQAAGPSIVRVETPAASPTAAAAAPKKPLDPKEKQRNRRANIAKEILSTEEAYVSHLQACLELYLIPLKDAKEKTMSAEEIASVFSILEDILKFHVLTLLPSIRGRVQGWSETQLLGDVFVKNTEFLSMYSTYINNFDTAIDNVSAINKRRAMKSFCEAAKQKPAHSQVDLSAYLIMPVQRVPRYMMLLSDLLKHTPKNHPDFKNLRAAVTKMEAMAVHLNEKKREDEEMKKLTAIQKEIQWGDKEPLAKPGRRFLRDGDFTLIKTGEIKSTKELADSSEHLKTWRQRFVVLKESRLIYYIDSKDANPKGVYELANTNMLDSSDDDGEDGFTLEYQSKLINFRVEDKAESKAWEKAIRKAIKNAKKLDHDAGEGDGSIKFTASNSPVHIFLLSDMAILCKKAFLQDQFKIVDIIHLAAGKSDVQRTTDNLIVKDNERYFYFKSDDDLGPFANAMTVALQELSAKELVNNRAQDSSCIIA